MPSSHSARAGACAAGSSGVSASPAASTDSEGHRVGAREQQGHLGQGPDEPVGIAAHDERAAGAPQHGGQPPADERLLDVEALQEVGRAEHAEQPDGGDERAAAAARELPGGADEREAGGQRDRVGDGDLADRAQLQQRAHAAGAGRASARSRC